MYTILLILGVFWLMSAVARAIDEEYSYIMLGFILFINIALLIVFGFLDAINTPQEIATPAKYTNQTYYIDNTKQLYIQQNDTTKPFSGDISSKIEYKESAKEPSIEFKSTKTFGDYDHWTPFKRKEEVKTSISKVILPKSDLNSNLTKVNVINTNQSESTDLSLSD